jgi:hypothetical protein
LDNHQTFTFERYLFKMKHTLLLFCLLAVQSSAMAQKRDVVTKQLGRFGPVEISFRQETENGKVSKSLYGNYQVAGSDDITDIGGFYFADSASAAVFCAQLLEAVDALDSNEKLTTWTGKSYQIDAVRSNRRIRISGVGRNSRAFTEIISLHAQKLSEVLGRSVHMLRD